MKLLFGLSNTTLTKFSLTTLLTFCLASWNPIAQAEDATVSSIEEAISTDQVLHTDLVLLALKADFYNRRCRGISVSKNFNKVNRLFITKYSLTANNYIKVFINPDVKAEKITLEREFKRELGKIGGCSAAKKQQWRKEINNLFNALYQQAEKSTWYPEEI